MKKDTLQDLENLVQNIYNKFDIQIPSIEYYKLLRDLNITIKYKSNIDILYDNCIQKHDESYIFLICNRIGKHQENFDIVRMIGNIILDVPYNTRDFNLENLISHFAIMYLVPKNTIQKNTNIKLVSEKYNVSGSMVCARIKIVESEL